MSLSRLLLRSLRRTTTTISISISIPNPHPLQTPHSLNPIRSLAFSSAEEAAAERRRRKRRLRIEPPLHALRRDPSSPRPPPDPNAPRLPDSTSSLVGARLNLHNRVQSLIRAGDLDSASSLTRHSVFSRTRPTVFTCNALTASMLRSQRYDDSISLFKFFFNQSNIVPNVVSYNILINSHCDCGRVDEALDVYRHIIANSPFSPSSVTYRHLTKGLTDSGRIAEAVDLLREMLSKGHGADSIVYNNLIKGFLDLGNSEKAYELFDELKERCLVYDGIVNATFMDWYFNQGKEKEAMESYRSLLDRKFRMVPATCNVLLECLLRHGRKKDACELFDTMLDNHTPPSFQAVNSDTFSVMVNECFKEGRFSEAVEAFRKVGVKMNSKPFSMDVAGYNNIIVRFAEVGMTSEAERFFEELRLKSLSPDVTGYRTLIDAYVKEKRIDDAVMMFDKMVDANLRVIPLYANKWFGELIENGKAVESSRILSKLGEKDPKPDVLTYEIVIKGLCEAREFDQCKEMINQMMGYSVGVTSSLREFVVDVFEKEGRKDEIILVLDTKRQVSRPYPSGNSGPQNPRLPQSNQTPLGQARNAGFSGSVGVSGSIGAAAGYTGPAYQSGSVGQFRQRENAGFGVGSYESSSTSSALSGTNGFVGSGVHAGYTGSQSGSVGQFGQRENARFGGAYQGRENAGFGAGSYESSSSNSASSGTNGYVGSGGNAGYTGSANQFATQNGRIDNGTYPGTNEQMGYARTGSPNHFVPQSGSMGHSEEVRHGGQQGYSGYSGQVVGHTENGRYQNSYGDGESSDQVGSAGYSQSYGNGRARY